MNDIQLCLLAAKTLISDPADWTQGACARDAEGGERWAFDPGGVCWCAWGATRAVCEDWTASGLYQSATRVLERCIGGDVGSFDDAHTHAEVMALFDRAIERAADPC